MSDEYEPATVAFKYNYGRIQITSTADHERLAELAKTKDFVGDMLSRAHADIVFDFRDEENAHIGPVHHPNRRDLYEARRRIRQLDHFRSLGRPRGPYRR
jgi:hypothetical protein